MLSPHVMSPVQLQSETLDAMRKAGTPPQIQYAFRKTGLLLTEANRRRCDPTLLKQWEDAIDEYFALSKDAKGRKRPDPRAWSSELPELLVRPLTKQDHDQVLECLRLMGPVQGCGMTILARSELAAVLLASACASAYQSAEEMGVTARGPARYASAEDFIVRRARELYAQGRA